MNVYKKSIDFDCKGVCVNKLRLLNVTYTLTNEPKFTGVLFVLVIHKCKVLNVDV